MATSPFGTHELLDAYGNVSQSVLAFGEDRLYAEIQRSLQVHNERVMNDIYPKFCEITYNLIESYGGTQRLKAEKFTEHGQNRVQKPELPSQNIGFPLERYGINVGWTRDWLLSHSVGELARLYTQVEEEDLRLFQYNIMSSLFDPQDYLTWRDYLATKQTLPRRALFNGASDQIVPMDVDGTTFTSNHTHFTASADPLTANADGAAIIRALITNVVQHGTVGTVEVYINSQEVAALQGVPGFYPYPPDGVRMPDNVAFATGRTLERTYNANNRPLGKFDDVEVWVKPWIPAGYLLAIDLGRDGYKPLAVRLRPGNLYADLAIQAEHEHAPLRGQQMFRDYGIGVRNRHMAAIHQVNATVVSSVAVYTAPTFIYNY